MTPQVHLSGMTLAAALLFSHPLPAQEPGAAVAINTAFPRTLKRPLLVTRTMKVDAKTTISSGELHMNEPVKSDEEMEFVDEILEVGTKGEITKPTRTIVKAFSTDDGDVSDPPLNGLTVSFNREGDVQRLELAGNRTVPKDEVDPLLRTANSVGLWLPFPKDARVGQSTKVDLSPLASLLVSNDLEHHSGEGVLSLESFDSKTSKARFRGKATLAESGDLEGIASSARYEGECLIETNVAESRIVSLDMKGTVDLEGTGSLTLKGSGSFAVAIRTQIGDAAESARRRKPVFRDRVIRMEDIGYQLSLPSYFGEVEDETGAVKHMMKRLIDGDQTFTILVQKLTGEDYPATKEFFDGALASLKQQFKDIKVEKVTSSLGSGQAFTGERPDKMLARIEIYPRGKECLNLTLVVDPKLLSAGLTEMSKARKSLKPLPK